MELGQPALSIPKLKQYLGCSLKKSGSQNPRKLIISSHQQEHSLAQVYLLLALAYNKLAAPQKAL